MYIYIYVSRPTKMIELFELCVNKGRLWSVQATVRYITTYMYIVIDDMSIFSRSVYFVCIIWIVYHLIVKPKDKDFPGIHIKQ